MQPLQLGPSSLAAEEFGTQRRAATGVLPPAAVGPVSIIKTIPFIDESKHLGQRLLLTPAAERFALDIVRRNNVKVLGFVTYSRFPDCLKLENP